ncbi:MAG TPA: glutamate 5-kinase [Sphingomicrobium sp.]|nr:glutamate 5-kinase [Sphingomicrobium sp.]
MATASAQSASGALDKARRVTVKVGSSLLARGEEERRKWLRSLAADLQSLRSDGRQVVVVSSGAVALGREKLGLRPNPRLDQKQAAAAAGQPLLMRAWDEAFAHFSTPTAQLLLTISDTEARRPWLNARATLDVLLQRGVIPIVNENDSVATEELRYGDNDRLSARVAQMVTSDVLLLLSDVDGLYDRDPARHADAVHLDRVETITPEIEALASPRPGSALGSGGMRTKLEAARIAQAFGCATIIASGRGEHPVRAIQQGARSTVVSASQSPASAYKSWIAGTLAPAGSVTVDEGAAAALGNGKSLLPSGVRQVTGSFERGSCVRVVGEQGAELARGITRYSAAEAQAIAGKRAGDIEACLGYTRGDELIHRDDLVLMR